MKTINLEGQVIDPYLAGLYEMEEVPYITSKSVKNSLNGANGEDVTIRLYSSGGNVFEGIEIANAIKNYSGRVEVLISSLAASIATVIASAADKVIMQQGSLYMIHQPSVGLQGMYDVDDLNKEQNAIEGCRLSIIDFYKTKTNLSEEKLTQLMSEESWLTPQQAFDYGFVDEIAEGAVQVAASIDETVHIYENKIRKDNDLNNKLVDKLKAILNLAEETDATEAAETVEETPAVEANAEAEATEEAETAEEAPKAEPEAEATEEPAEEAEATEEPAEEAEAEAAEEEPEATEEAAEEVSDNAEDYAALLEKAVDEIERLKADNEKLAEQVNSLNAKKEEANNKKAEAEAVINKLNALLSSDNEKLVVVNTETKKNEVKGRFEHKHI